MFALPPEADIAERDRPCIRAKSRRVRWWQMNEANPRAVEAVCGRSFPLQALVILYFIIIRV
jgi:hypothetical protein